VSFTSLRATGSRECAPDDGVREAIQRHKRRLDCFVARAPRNDGLKCSRSPLNVIASEAKQSSDAHADWIASSQGLLAMTGLNVPARLSTSLRAKRSDPATRMLALQMTAEPCKQRAGRQKNRNGCDQPPHRPQARRPALVECQPVAYEASRAGIRTTGPHDDSWQTSTHSAPTSSAIRDGAIRTAL
jgi:hypothetical protein